MIFDLFRNLNYIFMSLKENFINIVIFLFSLSFFDIVNSISLIHESFLLFICLQIYYHQFIYTIHSTKSHFHTKPVFQIGFGFKYLFASYLKKRIWSRSFSSEQRFLMLFKCFKLQSLLNSYFYSYSSKEKFWSW